MNSSMALSNRFPRLLSRLTQPHSTITNMGMQRRVRLLLTITLFFVILNILGSLVVVLAIETESMRDLLIYALPTTLAGTLTIAAYVLGRSSSPMRSVYLLMLNTAILTYGAILVTPAPTAAIKYASMIVFATLIAGLFLNVRKTAFIALGTLIGMGIVLWVWEPVVRLIFTNPAAIQWLEPFDSFEVIVTLLGIVGMNGCILLFMRLRDYMEADRLAEEKRAIEQEQLALSYKRSDEVKSAFLASMSHELRTPLNAIINFTRFVAKGSMGPVNQEQKDTLNQVINSARHLLNLINDVLDMSKIEAGSLKLFLEPNVDLKPILDGVTASGRALLGEKAVTLNTEIAPDLPALTADRQRLTQVLLNIMSNACKFTPEGTITLSVRQQAQEILFAIRDTGPGIAPEDQEAVFTAFKQTETGLRQGGGTGLGMPISFNLVQAHGGRMWLESEVGKGTAFFVALPTQHSMTEHSAA